MNRFGDNLLHSAGNEPLVNAMVALGVEFLLIGGLAVSWYCPDREVDDMDLLLNPTPENARLVARALVSLNLSGVTESSFARSGVRAPLRSLYYADLLTPKVPGLTFAEAAIDAVPAKLFGTPIKVAAPAVLIRLIEQIDADGERATQRAQDVRCLRRHVGT